MIEQLLFPVSLFPDAFDTSNDELFIKAKELIATRSSLIPYSPTGDIYKLRDCIITYAQKAGVVGMLAVVVSKEAEIGVLEWVKYPIVFVLIKSMLSDIDRIVLGNENNYSYSISKDSLKDVVELSIENYVDEIKESVEEFGKRIEGFYDKLVSGKLFSSNNKRNKRFVVSKIQFSTMGMSIASSAMVFGWVYLHFLDEKIKKHGRLDFGLDDNIVTSFVEEFKSQKDAIKRVGKYACETLRTPIPDDAFLCKDFDEEVFMQNIISSLNKVDERFVLERDEQSKVAGDAFILTSFEKSLIINEIASYTTHILLDEQTIANTILPCFGNANSFRVFKASWEIMVNRGLKSIVDLPEDNLDNIKSRYCNYLSGRLDWPEYVKTDYGDYSCNLFYPCVQGADSIVKTMNTVFDVNQREPEKTEASALFLLWSFMFAEVYRGRDGRISESETARILPFILFVLIRMFAPINRPRRECYYNTVNTQDVYYECKKAIPQLDELLEYLPECFEVLKASTMNERMWIMCVNFVITRFVADSFNNLLLGHYTVESAIRALDNKDLSELFVNYFLPIYKRLN